MSVLIRGMEMPTEEEISKCIIIRHDGEVWICEFDNLVYGGYVACYPTNPMRAVPVPPHGRLIDADELKKVVANAKHMDAGIFEGKTLYSDHLCVGADFDDVCAAIDETPTIIEAEEGET